MINKKTLVLCVDRDNDLKEKAGISGPFIGRAANLDAATKLALSDPEDTDANTIFETIKLFDQLSKEHKGAEYRIVTVTGSSRLGMHADREITRQLDRVLRDFPATSCVFVTDGAEDEVVLPIVSSRMKIDSARVVTMKQAKELEKTYFVLLEKLREPYYRNILIGIPALVLLAFAISDILGFGWKPVVVLLGLYLLLKGFGFEESISSSVSSFKVSLESTSFVLYIAAIPLALISLWLGFQQYTTSLATIGDPVKVAAYTLSAVLILMPWAVILVLLGKSIDLWRDNRRFELLRQFLYIMFILLLWYLVSSACDWVVANAYFSDFVRAIVISMFFAYIAVEAMKALRTRFASEMKLENKETLTEVGSFIGRIVGVDRKKGYFLVQTPLGQKLTFSFERISSIGEKVVVRY